jgi:hypothetical protein
VLLRHAPLCLLELLLRSPARLLALSLLGRALLAPPQSAPELVEDGAFRILR